MSFPKIDLCLICDAVRVEQGGKLSVLGLLGVAPHVQITVPTLDQALPLAFVMLGGPAVGPHTVTFQMADGEGHPIVEAPAPQSSVADPSRRSTILLQTALLYPGPGKYRLQVLGDGATSPQFEAEFELRIGQPRDPSRP